VPGSLCYGIWDIPMFACTMQLGWAGRNLCGIRAAATSCSSVVDETETP
jgi:hypothetical protein